LPEIALRFHIVWRRMRWLPVDLIAAGDQPGRDLG
jgi:hypothetical protein